MEVWLEQGAEVGLHGKCAGVLGAWESITKSRGNARAHALDTPGGIDLI